MMWGYGFGWSWVLMSFGMILWIALLVVLVWALIRWLERKTSAPTSATTTWPTSEQSAEEILRQRYARGEIDAQTFERMRAQLDSAGLRNEQTMSTRN